MQISVVALMKLCDKIRYLREVEGQLRGLGRAMTQGEMVRAIREEMNEPLSQSYLSQIESGARPHLTNTTRLLLAKFFKVHPGYLVEDPEGYQDELVSDLRQQVTLDEKLDLWLIGGAERFRRDPELSRALLAIARHDDSRRCLLLLESILETPSLSERLLEVLRPEEGSTARARKTPLLVTAEPAREKSAESGNGSGKSSGNGLKGNGVKSSQGKRGGSKR
ncbi:MAG TPA: transcriptional regulator [Acidobacteriaceae bacterium]|nr:transcriptional regulator [Acidobacteriaceae bacterium]